MRNRLAVDRCRGRVSAGGGETHHGRHVWRWTSVMRPFVCVVDLRTAEVLSSDAEQSKEVAATVCGGRRESVSKRWWWSWNEGG